MKTDSPPPEQTVQEDARRTARISCCILERLCFDRGKATQGSVFPQCDRILAGGLILNYQHTPAGKNEWSLPLRASPPIKLSTDKSSSGGSINGLLVCRSQI